LGIDFRREEGNVVGLYQTAYIDKLLSRYLPGGPPRKVPDLRIPCDHLPQSRTARTWSLYTDLRYAMVHTALIPSAADRREEL
jgi:hypothetical protein